MIKLKLGQPENSFMFSNIVESEFRKTWKGFHIFINVNVVLGIKCIYVFE